MKDVTKQTFRIFWDNARAFKWPGIAGYSGFAAAVVLGLIIPIFYKQFFDELEKGTIHSEGAVPALVHIIVLILILHLVQQVLYRFGGYMFNRFQPKSMERMANINFEYLHGHSYSFFVNRFVGSLVRKANRLLDAFERIQDHLIFDIIPLFLRITISIVVFFVWKPEIGFLLLAWTGLFLGLNYWFTMYKMKFDVRAAEIDSEATAYLADTITNNQNVKLFTAQKAEQLGFQKHTRRQRDIRIFIYDLGNWSDLAQGLMMVILEFTIFYIAITQWKIGKFTIGDFTLIQSYLLIVFQNIWQIGRIIQRIYQNLANAEEMTTTLNMPHDVQDKPGAAQLMVQNGEVAFHNVHFRYHQTREIIHDFTLTVRPGEKIGLVGPSGAGKTTLVGLLFRFFDVTSGKITVDGQSIAQVTQNSLRKAMAFVPQDPILFHRTLKENIRYGKPGASDEEVIQAAQAAHCDEFIAKLPDGYDTFVGERGIKLSGGERQRVAIARAILKNAPILVLDEATSSLDSHVEAMIQDALSRLMEGKTVIVIAHRLSTINKMDRIVVVDEGSIKEEGTHDGLLQRKGGLYKKLWELQAGGFIA